MHPPVESAPHIGRSALTLPEAHFEVPITAFAVFKETRRVRFARVLAGMSHSELTDER